MTYDAFIFDMDGTLWDAVDGYCDVWNATIDAFGIACPRIDRDRLFTQMGQPLDVIMDALIPGDYDREAFMARMRELEAEIVPRRGGVLYPRVREVIEELRRRGAHISLVSNCGASGLRNFFAFTGLGDLFDDSGLSIPCTWATRSSTSTRPTPQACPPCGVPTASARPRAPNIVLNRLTSFFRYERASYTSLRG